jgi:hypothetical protein
LAFYNIICARCLFVKGDFYEYQENLDVSYGDRLGTGPQDAVRDLTRKLQFERFSHIAEADIKARASLSPSCRPYGPEAGPGFFTFS